MSITFKNVAHFYLGSEVETEDGKGVLYKVDETISFACVKGIGWRYKAKPYLKRLPEGAAPTCDMAAQGYDCHGLIDSGEAIEVEQWQPNNGEVCWFWDEIDRGPRIRRFKHKHGSIFVDMECNSGWQHCAPFTGELPEFWAKKWGVKS